MRLVVQIEEVIFCTNVALGNGCARKVHDCVAKYNANMIVKFPIATTVVEQINNNKWTKYRKEFKSLVSWYQANNLAIQKGWLLS